jgi:lysophospholipase L1-like esterase
MIKVIAGIIILMFVALEIGARWLTGQPILSLENLAARQANLLQVNAAAVYDPLLGWGLRPGLKGGSGNHTFTVGEFGFRMNSPEIIPPATNAIIAVGDSFTAGSEVSDNESWPAQLERMVGTRVLNAASGAWATDQIVLRALDLAPKLQPQTVIISFLADDILRAGYRVYGGANKPYFEVVDGKLVHHHNPVPIYTGSAREVGMLRNVLGYSEVANIVARAVVGWTWSHGRQYTLANNDAGQVTCLLLERIKKDAAEKGYRLLLVMQYGGYDIETLATHAEYVRPVLACVPKIGIEMLDLWQPLKEAHGNGTLRSLYMMHSSTIHGHMSAKGNAFVATHIAKALGGGKAPAQEAAKETAQQPAKEPAQ